MVGYWKRVLVEVIIGVVIVISGIVITWKYCNLGNFSLEGMECMKNSITWTIIICLIFLFLLDLVLKRYKKEGSETTE